MSHFERCVCCSWTRLVWRKYASPLRSELTIKLRSQFASQTHSTQPYACWRINTAYGSHSRARVHRDLFDSWNSNPSCLPVGSCSSLVAAWLPPVDRSQSGVCVCSTLPDKLWPLLDYWGGEKKKAICLCNYLSEGSLLLLRKTQHIII